MGFVGGIKLFFMRIIRHFSKVREIVEVLGSNLYEIGIIVGLGCDLFLAFSFFSLIYSKSRV